MLAEFTIVGRLGGAPTLIQNEGGPTIAKLSIATTKTFNRGGEFTTVTHWHRVTAFGRRAERLAERLDKGDKVWLRGNISQSSYEKDGRTIYATDLLLSEYRCLSPRSTSTDASAEQAAA